MPRPGWLSTAITAICSAFLPACDQGNLQAIKPGISTRVDVRSRLGPPTAEYRNEDGSVTWEYNRQPGGTECHMITFDAGQVVLKVEQVLNEANFARVQPGMTKDQIRRLLGRPGTMTTFERLHEEVWDWRITGDLPMEEAHFHVHFDAGSGLVKKTSRRVEQRG